MDTQREDFVKVEINPLLTRHERLRFLLESTRAGPKEASDQDSE
jgi:hypothetical protein